MDAPNLGPVPPRRRTPIRRSPAAVGASPASLKRSAMFADDPYALGPASSPFKKAHVTPDDGSVPIDPAQLRATPSVCRNLFGTQPPVCASPPVPRIVFSSVIKHLDFWRKTPLHRAVAETHAPTGILGVPGLTRQPPPAPVVDDGPAAANLVNACFKGKMDSLFLTLLNVSGQASITILDEYLAHLRGSQFVAPVATVAAPPTPDAEPDPHPHPASPGSAALAPQP